jgi:Anti-sigma-K factor rskA
MAETPQNQPDEAMLDLLIKQVTEGLSPAEQRTLDALDSEAASAYLRDFEHAVAVLDVAATPHDSMPAGLAQTLNEQAAAHFAGSQVVDLGAAREARREVRPVKRGGALGWFAAAACLVLALFGWLRTPEPQSTPLPQMAVVPEQPPEPAPVVPPTDAEVRLALIAKPDSLKITLSATKDPAAEGVSGDVVWDPASQKGFFHFVGLKANDPKVQQFQIWIFDAGRDKRYPVDGGVFDVPADSNEIIIPIRAALMVLKPAAFAVTVEKPGGVVVSAKDHVIVLGTSG